ncbi:hypothetical protein KDAU_56670 [Dictyobacter aurantiacus]|uniref:Uncharacterized protein n=1 Tax=Dictyobacter aurantiacus TaxID=1936993 RepID=A0A401ZN73_9CHLR|nr:hypothetical protein KDAU_56670 [Dictyobacter aurantiacus]
MIFPLCTATFCFQAGRPLLLHITIDRHNNLLAIGNFRSSDLYHMKGKIDERTELYSGKIA